MIFISIFAQVAHTHQEKRPVKYSTDLLFGFLKDVIDFCVLSRSIYHSSIWVEFKIPALPVAVVELSLVL